LRAGRKKTLGARGYSDRKALTTRRSESPGGEHAHNKIKEVRRRRRKRKLKGRKLAGGKGTK